jgi:alpha-tubulin suppressor-like RCC1 family protein
MKRHDFFAILMAASAFGAAGCDAILGLKEATLDEGDAGSGGASTTSGTTSGTAGSGVGGTSVAGCASDMECPSGPNGHPTCNSGVCGFECAPGFADCDSDTGCETDATTKDNCGACGKTCFGACVNGSCNDSVLIAAGYEHTCAIREDGSLWCWGFNLEGEIGDGTTTTTLVPTQISLPGPVTAVSAGGGFVSGNSYSAHTCAILADKSLVCWGSNGNGELGVGDNAPHTGPQTVPLSNVVQVAVGAYNTCAILDNHDLYCWGKNNSGQVGNGATSQSVLAPEKIDSLITAVSVGGNHACALRVGGVATCWGHGSLGQLGYGGTDAIIKPGVTVLNNAIEVNCGLEFSCARSGVGLFCWGKNDGGQLGIGDTMTRLEPQPVNLPGVSLLELGHYHSGALVGSTLYTWGANNAGQLGDGTGVNSSSPKPSALADVAGLSLGEQHTCAVTADHTMYCWGKNAYGQLGDGTQNDSSNPVLVSWP